MEQRKGPSGANAPPVHGIKKCLSVAWILLFLKLMEKPIY
jgi:hypothetical protein